MHTTLSIAKAMLKCIQELHNRGFVHRDVKPGNFLFRNDREQIICLIDFGLSRKFVNMETMEVLPSRGDVGFVGTCSFASVNAQEGRDQGRRDDLISWIYTVVEVIDRRLPWPGSKDRDQTLDMKKTIQPMQLCRSLPSQFGDIYRILQKMQFADVPDYNMFYELIDDAVAEHARVAMAYDWESVPHAMRQLTDLPMPTCPRAGEKESTGDKSGRKKKGKDKGDDGEVGCKCSVV